MRAAATPLRAMPRTSTRLPFMICPSPAPVPGATAFEYARWPCSFRCAVAKVLRNVDKPRRTNRSRRPKAPGIGASADTSCKETIPQVREPPITQALYAPKSARRIWTVLYAMNPSSATMHTSAVTIMYIDTMRVSAMPLSSKWWCSGAILNTRLPWVALK